MQTKKNWLDLRCGRDDQVMNAWCHGAPGILLARMKLAEVMDSEIVKRDIRLAAHALFMQSPGNHLCLCHGAAGNLLIMQLYLQWNEQEIYRRRYEEMASAFVQNLDKYRQKLAYEYYNPALMTGVSGVGMTLLQMYENNKNMVPAR